MPGGWFTGQQVQLRWCSSALCAILLQFYVFRWLYLSYRKHSLTSTAAYHVGYSMPTQYSIGCTLILKVYSPLWLVLSLSTACEVLFSLDYLWMYILPNCGGGGVSVTKTKYLCNTWQLQCFWFWFRTPWNEKLVECNVINIHDLRSVLVAWLVNSLFAYRNPHHDKSGCIVWVCLCVRVCLYSAFLNTHCDLVFRDVI